MAASTLSASSAAVILASSAAFVVSTAFSFSARWAAVKLLSPAISDFSAFAASSSAAFAAVLSDSRSPLLWTPRIAASPAVFAAATASASTAEVI